jgi:mRNA interferase RelE/StbE
MSDSPRWEVHYHRNLEKEIRRLPKQYIGRVLEALEALAFNPRPVGSKKIQGHELWRLQVGVYRVLYEIDEDNKAIRIYRLGHRRDIYRNL